MVTFTKFMPFWSAVGITKGSMNTKDIGEYSYCRGHGSKKQKHTIKHYQGEEWLYLLFRMIKLCGTSSG